MKYTARDRLYLLEQAEANVRNIKNMLASFMQCRLNSICKHEDHESTLCPHFLTVYNETREIARPMFDHAKKMVKEALIEFERIRDGMIDTFPPDMSDEGMWDMLTRMIEGGMYDMSQIVANAYAVMDLDL